MQTQFLTFEIELPDQPEEIQPLILRTLQQWGTPLRWAIATLPPHSDRPTAIIEAVITCPD